MTWPVAKQSRQGPSAFCSSKSLQQPRGLVGVGDDLEVAALVVEHQPGGVCVDQFDAALGQCLQELDDVELLHEGVRELDENLREALFPRHHALPPRSSGSDRLSGHLVLLSTTVAHLAEVDRSVENVACQLTEGSLVGERPRTEQDQGLGQADRGLHGDDAGCLVHLGAVVEGPAGCPSAGHRPARSEGPGLPRRRSTTPR